MSYRILTLLCSSLFLIACEKTYTYCPYTFVNQECSYLICNAPIANDGVSAQEMHLRVLVTGYNEEMLENAENDKSVFFTDGNKEIESLLKEALSYPKEKENCLWWNNQQAPSNNYVKMEYRTVSCVNLEIYASEELFGVSPGGDLSEHMVFALPYHNEFKTPIISNDNRFMGLITDGLTIKEYLDMAPMVFGEAEFRFKSIPKESLPLTLSFGAKIDLGNGATLYGESNVVTLK